MHVAPVELTPELALAIERGVEEALKAYAKTQGDPRDLAAPDQKVEGLVINLTLEVGEMSIGHDTDKTPTTSIPMLPTLALLVKRMGATREAALTMLKEVMTEALSLGKDASAMLLLESGVAETEKAIKDEVIATLPRSPVKKTVKVKDTTLTITGVASRAV